MFDESTPAVGDPYSEPYVANANASDARDHDHDHDHDHDRDRDHDRDPPPAQDRRSRSRSPARASGYRSPPSSYERRKSPPPKRPSHAPDNPNPSSVLGVFGLSIRTTERDLEDEFNRHGRTEKVTIVYDQRSGRSRGFGFIQMSTVEEAARCIQELNGLDLNGRRIRVDYSVTTRPHAPTPGEYMGHRRSGGREPRRDYGRDSYRDRDSRRDYDRHERDRHDRDRYDRDRNDRDRYDRDRNDRDRYDREKERDRDLYGRDSRDWKERKSPPPKSRNSPARSRRSYSRSPPRGAGSGSRGGRDYDRGNSPVPANGDSRW